MYPSLTSWCETATGHDAMQMRMEVQILSSAMQDGEETDLHAQAFGIGGNLQQCLCSDAKQNVVDDRFVVETNGGDFFRQGEHDMEVLDRQ